MTPHVVAPREGPGRLVRHDLALELLLRLGDLRGEEDLSDVLDVVGVIVDTDDGGLDREVGGVEAAGLAGLEHEPRLGVVGRCRRHAAGGAPERDVADRDPLLVRRQAPGEGPHRQGVQAAGMTGVRIAARLTFAVAGDRLLHRHSVPVGDLDTGDEIGRTGTGDDLRDDVAPARRIILEVLLDEEGEPGHAEPERRRQAVVRVEVAERIEDVADLGVKRHLGVHRVVVLLLQPMVEQAEALKSGRRRASPASAGGGHSSPVAGASPARRSSGGRGA